MTEIRGSFSGEVDEGDVQALIEKEEKLGLIDSKLKEVQKVLNA